MILPPRVVVSTYFRLASGVNYEAEYPFSFFQVCTAQQQVVSVEMVLGVVNEELPIESLEYGECFQLLEFHLKI